MGQPLGRYRKKLVFVVPGPLTTLTGGYIYDARILEGLRRLNRPISELELGCPIPTPREIETLKSLESPLLIDGLSLPHFSSMIAEWPHPVFALIHHPCSLEPDARAPDMLAAQEREALASVDGVLATSSHTAGILSDFGVDPTSVHVIHPGTDPQPLTSAANARNPPELLCVASLTPRKGHDLLLDALEHYPYPYRLTLVGSAKHASEWSARILERLPEQVDWYEALAWSAILERLATTDLFVFPSRYEGFGMAPLEAIRSGVPVLSTRTGALPEALPEEAVEWVEATAGAIRTGLARALQPERLATLRAAARAAAPTLPTWGDAVTAFDRALRSLGAYDSGACG